MVRELLPQSSTGLLVGACRNWANYTCGWGDPLGTATVDLAVRDRALVVNLSPDPATGIGNWTAQQFIERFRVYQGEAGRSIPVAEGGNNTLMSWTLFADMADEDLAAIYAYLMASEPRVNEVVVWD